MEPRCVWGVLESGLWQSERGPEKGKNGKVRRSGWKSSTLTSNVLYYCPQLDRMTSTYNHQKCKRSAPRKWKKHDKAPPTARAAGGQSQDSLSSCLLRHEQAVGPAGPRRGPRGALPPFSPAIDQIPGQQFLQGSVCGKPDERPAVSCGRQGCAGRPCLPIIPVEPPHSSQNSSRFHVVTCHGWPLSPYMSPQTFRG